MVAEDVADTSLRVVLGAGAVDVGQVLGVPLQQRQDGRTEGFAHRGELVADVRRHDGAPGSRRVPRYAG